MKLNNEIIKSDINKVIEYVKIAEKTLETYVKHRELVKNGNIIIGEINQALSEYKTVSDFLIAEYERKALESDLRKSDFDEWFAEKYFEAREELNPVNLAGTKWAGSKEIEMKARINNKTVYKEKKDELLILNREVATLRRLCDSYKRMDGIFQTLSNNHRSDLKGYSLPNRMNNDYEKKEDNPKSRTIKKEL